MLKDLIALPEVVKIGNHQVTVNPLTLSDIAKLSGKYYPELTEVLAGSMENLPSLVTKAPIFVATLIAYATGEPEEFETAAKLPAATQLLILQAIWNASMVEEEAVGKLLISLSKAVSALNKTLKENVQKQLEQVNLVSSAETPPTTLGT